jgi:hypothetical protein
LGEVEGAKHQGGENESELFFLKFFVDLKPGKKRKKPKRTHREGVRQSGGDDSIRVEHGAVGLGVDVSLEDDLRKE